MDRIELTIIKLLENYSFVVGHCFSICLIVIVFADPRKRRTVATTGHLPILISDIASQSINS